MNQKDILFSKKLSSSNDPIGNYFNNSMKKILTKKAFFANFKKF